MAQWSSGEGGGFASRWSRVQFPAAATNSDMIDRLQVGKPCQYFTKPPRPSPHRTVSGTGNEYQPKCGDTAAGWLKAGMVHFTHLQIDVWVAVKTV